MVCATLAFSEPAQSSGLSTIPTVCTSPVLSLLPSSATSTPKHTSSKPTSSTTSSEFVELAEQDISAKLEFEDELSPVPTHDYYISDAEEYVDSLKCVVDLLGNLGYDDKETENPDTYISILNRNPTQEFLDNSLSPTSLKRTITDKEKELEIAARIGQSLLKKVGTLEGDLHHAQSNCQEMEHKLNQLNHEVTCKDELLKFVDKELEDREDSDNLEMKGSLLRLGKECQNLKEENSQLKDHQQGIRSETMRLEAKETALIQHCVTQLGGAIEQIGRLEVAAEQKSEEIVVLKRDLSEVTSSLTHLTKRHVLLIDDNNDLRLQVQNMREEQKLTTKQLALLQKKYEECLQMLEDSRKYMNRLSSPVTPSYSHTYETPSQPTPSIMNELEDAIITDLQQRRTRKPAPKKPFVRSRARMGTKQRTAEKLETTDDSDNKDSGVRSGTDSEGEANLRSGPHSKRRLTRGTVSPVVSEAGPPPPRDALQDLMGGTTPGYASLTGSAHSLNSDITSVSEACQSEPAFRGACQSEPPFRGVTRHMYGTNKLKMVKPLEGSMTLLQWKLLAMKQSGSALLTSEDRPGVVQRNTVSSALSDNEGIGGLGDVGLGGRGIFSKGAMAPARATTPSQRNGVFSRTQANPASVATPLTSKTTPNAAAAASTEADNSNPENEAVKDLFAYLSNKYEVPKNTISADFSTGSSETRAGSKVKVEPQPRTRTITPDLSSQEEEPLPYIRKQPASSSGISSIGRILGWT